MSKISQSPYIPDGIDVEEIGENTIRVSAYPFESGNAITLAHPLKRLLMSSSAGYSAVGVQIDNVKHEFDSLNGMKENITQFLINIKNIHFKILDEDKEELEVAYSFNKAGEIQGKDLSNEDIEITNDILLATLNDDCELKFKIIVKKGIGYVPSEDLVNEIDSSYIVIDASFTPVKKAIYSIEKILIGDNQDFEKIVFELQTTGQISPIKAFEEAVNIMYGQMKVFEKSFDIVPNKWVSSNEDEYGDQLDALLGKIDKLNLSSRCFNALAKSNIHYIGSIVLMSENMVKDIPSLGKKSLEELFDTFEDLGFPVGKDLESGLRLSLEEKLKELEG
jgi:DNA-directed RNA polymerase subunit alpha